MNSEQWFVARQAAETNVASLGQFVYFLIPGNKHLFMLHYERKIKVSHTKQLEIRRDRQTDRQTYRQAGRQADSHINSRTKNIVETHRG